jgi:hypothetical protein
MFKLENYKQEVTAIKKSQSERTLFKGKVESSVSIFYDKKTPENYYPIHLNRSLLGLSTPNLKTGEQLYAFGGYNSSIFKLLCELEYLRAYSKFKDLKIMGLTIYIYNMKDVFINNNISDDEYRNLFFTELKDISRCHLLPRFFSGSLHAKVTIKYRTTEEITIIEGDYQTIYLLIAELEELRNSAIRRNNPLLDIAIELTELDDSRVIYRESVMKRKDERAQREI